jgi:hypothetical protein
MIHANTLAIAGLMRGDSLVFARFDRSDCLALLSEATRRTMADQIARAPERADYIVEQECRP